MVYRFCKKEYIPINNPRGWGRKYFFVFSNEKYESVLGQLSIKVYFGAAT